MDYFQKIDQKPTPDLTWNLPEQKRGVIKIIGGNNNSFRTEVKTAEFLANRYPVEVPTIVLPDSLKAKLPPLPNVIYLSSTDSGSFANTKELSTIMATPDFNLVLGDLSKNSVTAGAVHDALKNLLRPTLITRDTIDLIAEHQPESTLMNPQIIFFASMPQLQKLFRAVYYPKVLLLSQSLVQVADALHKFTLSYPTKIITLHNEQILIAANGEVKAVPLAKTGYQPLTFWNGELATKIVALNLFNPDNFINATICALFA
ncbi:hypothetical protein IKE80_02125 [Candidatus Saccharibacteria bacterium]|nr:hypothetical protein [Candidatus Saccharibacteria bacterium]MBR3177686.1 hypothetical protein [Candidatus Saccharibacteria bacterium]